jgi:adenosylmethionine-8-amino-7-oxononanoate aminotransferase
VSDSAAGAWYASSLWDLDPDLLTVAKGVTSGYLPLGATLVAEEIVSVLNSGGYLAYGFTYSGHPVAAAAALANVAILEREGLADRVRDDVGPYFQKSSGPLRPIGRSVRRAASASLALSIWFLVAGAPGVCRRHRSACSPHATRVRRA